MIRILPVAAFLSFILGCAQRVRQVRAGKFPENPSPVPSGLKDSESISASPSEIVGSSRCGPRGSENKLRVEARKNAWENLLRKKCPPRRAFQSDGTFTLVPSGRIKRLEPERVRGNLCVVQGSAEMGIRIYVAVDADRAEVECPEERPGESL